MPEVIGGGDAPVELTCSSCGAQLTVYRFPALMRQLPLETSEASKAQADEATCYHHPERRAEAVCETCGRFLCGLCGIHFNGQTLCPACLALRQTAAADAHIPRRVRYDRIAMLCVLLAPFVYCLSFVNAGVALFLCIRYWKTPLSVLPRSRWRFVVAGFLATGLLAIWIGVAAMLVYRLIWREKTERPVSATRAQQTEVSHAH